MHQVELGRAAARARLGAGVADAGAVRRPTLPADRAGRKKKGLGEAGLTRPAGAHERDRSGACRSGGHASLSSRVAKREPRRSAAALNPASVPPFGGELQGGRAGGGTMRERRAVAGLSWGGRGALRPRSKRMPATTTAADHGRPPDPRRRARRHARPLGGLAEINPAYFSDPEDSFHSDLSPIGAPTGRRSRRRCQAAQRRRDRRPRLGLRRLHLAVDPRPASYPGHRHLRPGTGSMCVYEPAPPRERAEAPVRIMVVEKPGQRDGNRVTRDEPSGSPRRGLDPGRAGGSRRHRRWRHRRRCRDRLIAGCRSLA